MFVMRSKTSQVWLGTLQHEYPGKGRYWGHGRRLSRSCHPQELELPTLLHTRCEFYNFELERRISLFHIGMLNFILRFGMSSLNRFRAGAVGFYWLVLFFLFLRVVIGNPMWYILSDWIPHWFEGSVSVLCYQSVWTWGQTYWYSFAVNVEIE